MAGRRRLGVLIHPLAPFPVLGVRWRALEELGVDQLWLPDHSADYMVPAAPWFDGWTMVAHAAMLTHTIRVGTLVSNPVLRAPALLAREALAVDHLSEGRLELGIGAGIAQFDHRAMGVPYWEPKERAQRLAEYVAVVDGVLRSGESGHPFEFAGAYHRTAHHPLVPAPVQRPRPPITLGGQSPTVLRTAARLADCWNTHGPFGAAADEVLARTRDQSARVSRLCERAGRDPHSLRRSLLCHGALDPWRPGGGPQEALQRFARTVDDFGAIGFTEFVVYWPPRDDLDLLARALRVVRES